ncbi:RHS repeat-associated core domain-containing protein [Chryseobacterium pennipullorum]|uniref:RHS repeat-associated core domain-containing protein n=1 Tax=Chryseobacterium pennipullorum TaxID=2258963 RepID=A0A3D9B4A9_9FLAO|nr:RHS repeat-associated core domain-containing protein [Chryseobacterium pennipullorum]REC48042.1 hypothetical protein DRF67_09130 [Chryseobacterium pennipullorum]
MKLFSTILVSLSSVMGFSQTILYQPETTSRTVQDPQSVVLAQGFYAQGTVSNPFVAKLGPASENPGGGPTDSNAGATNPIGTSGREGVNFHDTKGDIDVSAGGQLQFTLPIALPPGVKTVAPQINLVYASGSGNGIAGYGWSISGITAISRIGKTIEKDGDVKGIQLDYSDVYSFNGQRLILKSGQYGKDGAEYVTEKYSNARFRSVGNSLNIAGPDYWEVTYEDGSQAWYNRTFTNRQGDTRPALEYNITKWKDVHGNYITYGYSSLSGFVGPLDGRKSLLTSISWGGNETLNKPHFNEILLQYKDRVFKEINYLQGEEFQQDKILDDITVNTNGKLFKRYAVEYVDNSTSYQFAKKITEYNSGNLPANPVTFTYEQNNTTEHIPYQSFSSTSGTKKYADFNLDGETDYIEFVSNGVLKYKSSLYKDVPELTLSYDASKFSSGDFNKATPITFKKDNYIKNNIGLVVPVVKAASQPDMSDIELQIFSVDIATQKLVFEYSKTLQYDQYFVGDDTYKIDGWFCNYNFFTVSANAYDRNGDGVSELILNVSRTLTCTDPGIFQPVDPTDPGSGTGLPQQPTNPNDYTTTTRFYTTILYDLDQQVAPDASYYAIDQETTMYNNNSIKPTRLFADLNGDGLQDIIELKTSTGEILSVYNIVKYSGTYSRSPVGNFAGQSLTNMHGNSFIADFNGDSKADIMIPVSNNTNQWRLFISNGKSFTSSTIALAPFKTNATVYFQDKHKGFLGNSCDRVKLSYFNYDVNDIDGDGKSELIVTEVQYEEHEWDAHNDQENTLSQVSVYSLNKIDNYSMAQGTDTSGKYTFYKTRVWTNSYPQKAIAFSQITMSNTHQQLILVGKLVNCSGCTESFAQYYNHPSLTTISRINSIEQGGVKLNVVYKELNPDVNANFYLPVKKEEYPYYESAKLPKSFAVAQFYKTLPQGQVVYQDFRYRGFLNHNTGRGFIGYRQNARSSWYAQGLENAKIWSGTEIDPLMEGIPVKEWTIRTNDENNVFPTDISENNSQLLSFKNTVYQSDKLLNGQVVTGAVSEADKPKIVQAIFPKNTKSKDFLSGTTTASSVIYGEYYLPKQSVTTINNGYALTTSDFEYFHNAGANGTDYFIGRPKSRTDIMQVYGDVKSTKKDYGYENRLLKTLKTWNRDNTGYLQEAYHYDGFGNITQKIVSNSIDAKTQTAVNEYDPKGRFAVKHTDNLGLVTSTEYNDWGQIVKKTDPLGNITVNGYDLWGKLSTSKTNLEGTTTYQYDKDNDSNVKVFRYDPDGNVSIEYTNRIGQNYKTSTKAFGQGKYVSEETQFDALGRKIATSEPYFEGQAASQWNTLVYDDSVFPAKVTATSFVGKQVETSVSGLTTTVREVNGNARTTSNTKDALGNIISSTDKGGTINFSYNAAGEQIQAQYAGNVVTSKYDVWGRKTEFNDPSNGVYKYEYNSFGQTAKVISPKGTKEYSYNNFGQLVAQKELSTLDGGQATDKLISFGYDNKGRLTSKNGTSKGKAYTSNIVYDPQGRMLSTSESSNGKYFIQKGITYDDKQRVISYEKQLYSSGVLTKVTIENVYSAWNGELSQIKDKNSGKILWELSETNAKGRVLRAKLGAVDVISDYNLSNGYLAEIKHGSAVKPNLLNIKYQFDAIKNRLNGRVTAGDFNITESFAYDDNDRLIKWTNPVTNQSHTNVYDVRGRITENNQIGKIKFENSAKLYQPTGMSLNAEGVQNYKNDLIQTIVYNENNDPVFIDGEVGDVAFQYGLTAMRQMVTYGGNFNADQEGRFTKFYSEDGSFEVLKNTATGQEKHTIFIEGSPYDSNIVFMKNYTENEGSYKFLHKDYLGSILAISDEAGNKLEQRHFDAWGNFTHLQVGSGSVITDAKMIKKMVSTGAVLLERGYTSHEHFMEVGLIHMNGRLYDPLLRRFLNADENIQDPYNTQNYNKYGYVMNNPLMMNDPNGEFFQFLGLGILFWKAVIIGAYIGFTSYILTAAITNQGVSLAGGLKAIFFGAASGAVTFGIGSIFSSTAGAATQFAKSLGDAAVVAKAVVHGAAQGALSLMQNGGFKQSFFSGALGSLGASAFGAVAGKFANSTIGNVAFGAVAGGVASELTGGNFWKGAVIGGMVAGLNDMMHRMQTKSIAEQELNDVDVKDVNKEAPNTKESLDTVLKTKTLAKMRKDAKNASITYGKTSKSNRLGETDESTGAITLNKTKVFTFFKLYQTIGHELIHSIDFTDGTAKSIYKNYLEIYKGDKVPAKMYYDDALEFRAYEWEVNFAPSELSTQWYNYFKEKNNW